MICRDNLLRILKANKRSKRLAERVGFEPTCPFGQDAFEAPPLRPLRYLSVRCPSLKQTLNYIPA